MLDPINSLAAEANAWIADPQQAKADLSDSLLASREFVRRSHTLIALSACPRPARRVPAND